MGPFATNEWSAYNIHNADARYEALESCQEKYYKENDTQENPSVFSVGSTVVVQQEDGGLLMHGVIVEPNWSDHRGHSYTIWVTKRLITHNTKQKQVTGMTAEQYLCEQIRKAVGQLEDKHALPTEVNGCPSKQAQDQVLGAMQKKIHMLKEKGEIKENTPLHDKI